MLGLLITYESAGVGKLESARLDEPLEFIQRIVNCGEINECLVLQTCNRVELYAVASDGQSGKKALLEYAEENMNLDVGNYAEFLTGSELLEHLLRLAGGLESMIVGEDQILGQIKEAYEFCRKNGYTGKILNTAFEEAIKVGKLIRTETKINVGHISVGSAAVGLAEDLLGDLKSKDILIVGAGETAELVGRSLVKRDPSSVTVANRTYERGEDLAKRLGGKAIKFSNFSNYLSQSDVVISATGAPHLILEKEDIEGQISTDGGLVLIDIANPRDISENVTEIEGVELYNLDDLERIADRNLWRRKEECEKAEAIVERELRQILRKFEVLKTDEIVGEIYKMAEEIREKELKRAAGRLTKKGRELDEEQEEILDNLTKSVVRKILHDPISYIREASKNGDGEILDRARRLFKLGGEGS
ncbi:hypothetical protein AKJ43_03255 [candidate division MSBL1 archaeon SCGC-AAA261D19]|uniref:Glutamyl-tRNA reductase n=1 Tax=candidate division MSBL1 archaeon SCGC-AAA261D19 TaxID=1698273 RepID=A0A133V552_9EURY|nr:hypothetical protein AKJ43_03255 [candidate division MSBL1 archaeon SCGC-AAA261D19]